MKRKAEKRIKPQIKLEKKNKIIGKEEIEVVFGRDEEELKKKEFQHQKYTQKLEINSISPNLNIAKSSNQKKNSNINIFTEGISFEKIDQNKYNKALSNFNFLFTKDLNKKNNQKKAEKPDKKGQISEKYLNGRALYKEIEIEIKLSNYKNKPIDELIKLLNNFFISENNFIYYEYSNSRNISFNKLSEGDMLSYRYFFKNYDNINIDINLYNNKEEYIKQLDYVNTLNNLFYKFNINNKSFYIITPLYAFSFDYNKNIPLLLTSSKSLEAQLNKNDIKIIKIKYKEHLEKQNKNIVSKIINKKENSDSKNITDNNDKSEDDDEELEINNAGVPIGISKLYIGLFFNFFVNQNVLKPFNIFSNFEFEGCIFRKCKSQLNKLKKNGGNNNYEEIIIKIEGIIFEENIENIIDFFKNDLELNNYIIIFNKIRSTGNFYKENKEIESSFERLEFKDNNFYFYKQ